MQKDKGESDQSFSRPQSSSDFLSFFGIFLEQRIVFDAILRAFPSKFKAKDGLSNRAFCPILPAAKA